MLYGVPPSIPPAIRERFEETVDFDNSEMAATSVSRRAADIKTSCAAAARGAITAQKRDQERYRKVRSGGFTSTAIQLSPGDFVYLKKKQQDSLDIPASITILRVIIDKGNGIFTLMGKDGRRIDSHSGSLAKCHLPIMDQGLDFSLASPDANMACEICNKIAEKNMLLCDACNLGVHTYCLDPPLQEIPEGYWRCPTCVLLNIPINAGILANDEQTPQSDPENHEDASPGEVEREL
jgi:hypothetical protein